VFSYRGCRVADKDDNIVFAIDRCQLTGQVVNVYRVVIGFSREWNATDNPPRCHDRSICQKEINQTDEIITCNGERCSFNQNIFNFDLGIGLRCRKSPNFFLIYYNCINGKMSPDYTLFCLHFHSLTLRAA